MPVSRPPKTPLPRGSMRQRGQSLVEFALSSVVLLLLVGGLVDIGRAIYISEALSNAAREGARHGVWFDAPRQSHPYLYDAQIKAAVDSQLAAISLPASVLKKSRDHVSGADRWKRVSQPALRQLGIPPRQRTSPGFTSATTTRPASTLPRPPPTRDSSTST